MRVFLCVLAFSVAVFGGPLEHDIPLDWSQITPRNLDITPDGGPAVDLLKTHEVGSRIINGVEAPRNGYPYQAALIIDGSGFCGGSLISTQWVLTAAHCTETSNQVQVILGAHSVQEIETTQIVRTTSIIFNHPTWGTGLMKGDIALVQILDVNLNYAIRTIQLAPARGPNYAGLNAVLTGWGRMSDASNQIARVLQAVHLQVMTPLACRVRWVIAGSEHICTSGQSSNGNVGACNGDSGGPLVVDNTQVGIVSFGNQECEAGWPTVYARVSEFRDWITEVTRLV